MSDQDSTIFNKDENPTQPTDQTVEPQVTEPTKFELPQEVVEYVGEGKKYATPEEALRSVPHAQSYIEQLKAENEELRAKAEAGITVEEALRQIKDEEQTTETPSAQIDPSTIDTLLEQKLAQREARIASEANMDKVITSMSTLYGDKAEAKYLEVAQEAGLSVSALNKLAATSPSAVLKLAGIGGQSIQPTTSSTSSVNTDAFQQTTERPSAKVKLGASTKDLANAMRAAKQLVEMEE